MNKVRGDPASGVGSSGATGFRVDAWRKAAVVFVGLVLFIALGVSTVYRAGPHCFGGKTWGSKVHRSDFTVYRASGQAVLDGTNIYDAHNVRDWYYMYLPVFSLAMVPFALLNQFWASLLWYLLSVLMLWQTVYVSVRLVRRYVPDCRIGSFWLYSLTLLMVLWPAMSGLAR